MKLVTALRYVTNAALAAASLLIAAAPAAAQSEIVMHARQATVVKGDWHWQSEVS